MIKLRIVDDEFKNYSEDFSVSEFQATDAYEYFSTGETAPPPQEQISIQEDSGFAQTSDRSQAIRDGQDFNNNNNTQSSSDSGSSSSSSSSSTSDGGSSSSSSATSSGTSSGANVTGGEATTATAGSSAAGASAGAGAGATAATAGTATAATIAGSVTVVAAAICAIVAVTANIIKMAPTIIMSYFMAGTNYIQYVLDVSDLDDEVDYIISLSNPTFSYTYDLREDLTEDGKVEGLISGLKPHRYYKLQVLSVDDLGNVPHFTHEFITESEPKPEAVPRVEANIDYDNKIFNLDYNIFISDAYKTGSNTFVEFYINDALSSTDTNIDKDGYIIGQLQNLPNNSIVKGVVKTTYEEEVVEIGDFEYKVVYPSELNISTKPLATSNTQSSIDYVNNKFNLNYSIQISDEYNVGSNTFVEFYINDELLTTDSNINSDGYITGTLTNLPNEVTVVGVVKTTYNGEVIEIDNFEYDVLYPKEIITEDLAFKGTFASEPEVETSLGTSAACYQYVYAINTGFNNSAQTTDKYKLEVVGADDTVLYSYTGTNAMVSCAVDYDVEEAYVYLTPISVVYDEDMSFERRLIKTITNEAFVQYAGFVMRPGKDFIFTTKMSPLIMQESLICSYAKADESVVETSLEDGMVEVFGNSETQTAMVFQIVDSTGRIAGRKIIDLSQTSSFEVSFHTNGDYNLTEGYTIETTLDETPTLGEGEGYRLIVRDENDKFLGMGITITDVLENQSLIIPDLTPTFYNAALACARTVNGVEYIFENTANTDGCEHVFTPFEEGLLSFDAEYSTVTFGVSVGNIYSTDDIDITATITNSYQSGDPDIFYLNVPSGLTEKNASNELTSAKWTNLTGTEIAITNAAGTITYGRYTYSKATTQVNVATPDVKNKELVLSATILDCPDEGVVNHVGFNSGFGNALIADDIIPYTAVQDGDNWVVTIDELKDITLIGGWEYSFSLGDLEIIVTNFVGTNEALNISAKVNYYLDGQSAHAAEDDMKVYVDGYPALNGKEINLQNWSLAFYSDSNYTSVLTLSNEEDSMGQANMTDYALLYLQNPLSSAFYYKMTYGIEDDVLGSSVINLPTAAYDETANAEDSDDPTCYGTFVSNAVTFNLSGTEIVSTNMYNTYHITTDLAGIHYQSRVAHNASSNYEIYRTDFDSTNPYMAVEDIPYDSSYTYDIYTFRTVEIGGVEYEVYLGKALDSYTVSTMIVDGSYNASHGVVTGPTLTDNGEDQQYIDIEVIADYLISGTSVEIYWGNNDTIEINPQTVMGLEYAAHDYDQGVDGLCTVIINNHQAKPIESCQVGIQVIFTDYLSDKTGSKVVVKHQVRTGATELAEYNVTTKGYVFALEDTNLRDANGDTIQFTEYQLGVLGTANLYAIDSDVMLITEHDIA